MHRGASNFRDRIAPEAKPVPWDAYERSKLPIFLPQIYRLHDTNSKYVWGQILWQRHRLNFRPQWGRRGGGVVTYSIGLRAPSCHTSFPILSRFHALCPRHRAKRRTWLFLSQRETNPRAWWQHDVSFSLLRSRTQDFYQRYTAMQQKRALRRVLLFWPRVFTHWRTVMNSRWSSNVRATLSLRVLSYALCSSTYSISCGIPYTHTYIHVGSAHLRKFVARAHYGVLRSWYTVSFNAELHYRRDPFVETRTAFAAARKARNIAFKFRGINDAYSSLRCFIYNN